METEAIGSCPAEIVKVSTNQDGGCRITLDIAQVSQDIASKLMRYKMEGDSLVQVAFVKIQSEYNA